MPVIGVGQVLWQKLHCCVPEAILTVPPLQGLQRELLSSVMVEYLQLKHFVGSVQHSDKLPSAATPNIRMLAERQVRSLMAVDLKGKIKVVRIDVFCSKFLKR